MKGVLSYFFRGLLLLIIALVVFYFWGSSSTLNKNEYSKLFQLDVQNQVENDSSFGIITYNIGYLSGMTNNLPIAKPKSLFDDNLKKVTSELKKIKPDIIAFQEIDYDASRSYHINQEKEIAQLGYANIARAINWDERYVPFPYWPFSMHFGKVVSGQSILSKYPLLDHQRIVLQRDNNAPFYRNAFYLDRLAQVVKVNVKGKEVIVINVHLEAFNKQTRMHQFKEVLALFDTYRNDYPTILLGDFNSRARDEQAVIRKLIEMEHVGNVAFDVDNIKNTFDSKQPFERIDYIFYTKKSIECISGKVLSNFHQASDHLPIYMQFRLKE